MHMRDRTVPFSTLNGLTMVRVDATDETMEFETNTGKVFGLLHDQNCCEHVYIESIIGDLADLVGTPILLAEEASNHDNLPKDEPESHTWTFYKLRTIKGSVDIRWLGTSNGYYSESVELVELYKP
jgi:hypothetical protein